MSGRVLPLALLVVMSFCPLLVSAEEMRVVTWEEAVTLAAENNPDLRAALRSKESQRLSYKESFNGVMPSLSLSNSYTKSKGDTAQTNDWSARGTASIDVFNTARFADISSSKWAYEQAQSSLRAASSDVLLRLRSAFAELIFQQQLIDVSNIILRLRRNNAGLVSLRYDSGRESKGNRLRAQAELMEAEANLNQAQRDLKASRQEFKRRLGDDSPLVWIATAPANVPFSSSEEPAFDAMVEGNPQVALRFAQLNSAEAAVSRARSVLFPSLTASYTRSLQGTEFFPDQPSWSAAGVLSLPVFGGGPTSAYYSVAAAKRDRELAEENMRATRYQVRSTLESAWSAVNGAVEQVRVQNAFLEAARQRNQEADVRYSSGLMSYEDWERIVTDRVNFERSVIRAKRDAIVAQAQWDNARGMELGR